MKNLFLFLVIMIGLHSCSPSYRLRKEQKQDNKLYKEIISNDRVLPKAANVYNMLHPITQKIIYIKGKDSIRVDSIPYDVVRDSLIKVECPTVNFDSLKKAWTKVIYHNSTDTLIFPDTTCWRRAENISNQYLQLQGKYDQQTTQVTSISKSQNKTSLWLIGVSIFSFIIISGLTYLLFRK